MTSLMTSSNLLFTNESAKEGQPDKMRDQISDTGLDAIMGRDTAVNVVRETAGEFDFMVWLGEITTAAFVNFAGLVRRQLASNLPRRPKFCTIGLLH